MLFHPPSQEDPPGDGGRPSKRRKLRKGTFSCIECKRRKVRCYFAEVGTQACASCLRHGTRCMGQEFEPSPSPPPAPSPSPPPAPSPSTSSTSAAASAAVAQQQRQGQQQQQQEQQKYHAVRQQIGKVEALVEELMRQRGQLPAPADEAGVEGDDEEEGEEDDNDDDDKTASAGTLVVCEAVEPGVDDMSAIIDHGVFIGRRGRPRSPATALPLTMTTTKQALARPPPRHVETLAPGPLEYRALNRQLQSILPTTADALRIMHHGALFILRRYRSFVEATGTGAEGSRLAAYLQKRDSAHPVMLARELIQLAVCLKMVDTETKQAIEEAAGGRGKDDTEADESLRRQLAGLSGGLPGASASETADRYFHVACSLVTSQDSMVCSLEGLESLMLQAFYLASTGKLRSAWLCLRRALGIAQIMGLQPQGPDLEHLDGTGGDGRDSRSDYDDDSDDGEHQFALKMIWSRLLFSERFLSLMLGLPSCVAETVSEAVASAVAASDASEAGSAAAAAAAGQSGNYAAMRLERRHSVIMARIIARNERLNRPGGRCRRGQQVFYDDVWETQDIDYAFQQAAAAVGPPRWWTVPELEPQPGQTWPQRVDDMTRLLLQGKHYHLIVLLHLPYVTERALAAGAAAPPAGAAADSSFSSSHPSPVAFDCTYSKLSALTAAREVLVRFEAFHRGARRMARCCALDFEAFVAAMALLLAHIDGHGRGRASIVAHQRPADVAAVTQALGHMDELSRMNCEIPTGAGAALLRRLMAVEAEAAAAAAARWQKENPPAGSLVRFDVWTEEGTLGRGDGHIEDSGLMQTLSVPYFGTVHIRRVEARS